MHHKFHKIFASYERAHATYIFEGFSDDGKKIGRGSIVREESNPVHWQKHLDGDESLGGFPLLDDHTCAWAAIDIDDKMKGQTHLDLITKIKKHNLPLICFRSASGNAHLFVFFKVPVDAQKVREKLISWSALLGFAGCELFPKQTYRINKEDYGNWLNLPYFKGDATDRYAFSDEGKPLSVAEFLEVYEQKAITVEDIKPTFNNDEGTMFPDGPPCLKHIEQVEKFCPEGSRNNFLLDVCVYLKKKYPEDWRAKIHEYNAAMCDPKVEYQEVMGIVKSLERKDYDYMCKQAPIAQFCNKPACKRAKCGIGNNSSSSLEFDNITQYEGSPVKWIVEMQGARIEVLTEELFSQGKFMQKIAEQLRIMIKPVSKDIWFTMIEEAFKKMTSSDVIKVPEDASSQGQFSILLEDFCMQKATTKDEIFERKTWWDKDGFIYFSSRGLFNELDKNKFKYKSESDVYHILRTKHNGDNKVMRVKGKNMRVWFIPHMEEFHEEVTPTLTFTEADNPIKKEKEF